MSFLMLALALSAFSFPLLKGLSLTHGRIQPSGFNGVSVVVGFGITAVVAAATSPLMAVAFILAVLMHDIGAALACRFIGHDVARVRLVPIPYFAAPRSDRHFDTALEESYVALYAPALAIAPMVLCFALFHTLAAPFPAAANIFRAAAIMIGAFNFVMLLPFLPFGGGHVVRAISEAFWPRMGTVITVFMTAAFFSAALKDGSIAMLILTGAGLQSLIHKRRQKLLTLSVNHALLVMSAYAFILCVHFTGGWWLLNSLM
ncbi:hypothetical protein [Celeribacter marinus]|uniref:Uncharacterized protein n=1 Tax=Celeribacter marinus TaxID=1397108 RepID=A0A0P0A9N9_9RHOB|nr:hypothetical protein [Celeribacter marinus]ALI55378.1 hypothetical protein IMCC12053_1431 [Celeribacter marinus]SFL06591.1 hypothetical protein SAMN05444421_11518 [Celeribacter marinus]